MGERIRDSAPERASDTDRIDADARHLRERYGAQAEAWCESALAALPMTDSRHELIRGVALALTHIPIIEAPVVSAASSASSRRRV